MRERFLIAISKILAIVALICIMIADSDAKLALGGLTVCLIWFGLLVIANTRSDKSDTGKSI